MGVLSGTLQLIAVSFPSGTQPIRVLAEIDRVQVRGSIRVLDMLLVAKDQNGEFVPVPFSDDEDLGELVSRVLHIGAASGATYGGLGDGLWAQAHSLPADTSGLFILIEHRWAQRLFDVIEEEQGAVLGAAFLPPELAVMISSEVTTLENLVQSIAAAQAAEAQARLRTITALAEMDNVLAASTEIRGQATAEALRTLMIAGFVESSAAHEALDALLDAGLIIDHAADAAARAVAADEAVVAAVDEATGQTIVADLAAIVAAEQKLTDATVAASVTPAELRVLRYLSTPLTFSLIADKLGISRGAAKMRAERAYQKLGVHSRAEALQRVRELRVLP